MEFTRCTRGTVGVLVAFMVCGLHQAFAGGDPPSSATPVPPAKADTAVVAPAKTPAPTTTVTEGTAPVATPTARVPAVVVRSTLEDSVLTDVEVKQLLSACYKQEKMSNGDILYCRKEDHLGSIVPKKHCVTGAQLKAMAEDKRQFNDFVQEKAGMNPRPTAQSGSSP